MLRRPPTRLPLKTDDMAELEDAALRRKLAAAGTPAAAAAVGALGGTGDVLTPSKADPDVGVLSKQQRLGIHK